jgi:membrane protease YdiL (CAAX protease family)
VEKSSTSPPSPLSPTLWPASAFSLRRVGAFVGALLGGYLASYCVIRILALFWHPQVVDAQGHVQLNTATIVLQLLVYAPIVIVTFWLLPRTAGRSMRELGLRLPAARDVFAMFVGAAAMLLVTTLAAKVQQSLFHISGTANDITFFHTTHDRIVIIAFFAVAAFLAPFVEELVFRGFLFNALLRRTPVVIAAIVSSLLFGAAHQDGTAFFPLVCAGAVLCTVYYRTGSLTASIGSHGLFNLFQLILLVSGLSKDS